MSVRPWSTRIRGPANAWNTPPGEYGRKTETQRNWRGPAQAVEHVVSFDTTRKTLPALDIWTTKPVLNGMVLTFIQVLHGCRQLVSWDVWSSPITSETLVLCCWDMRLRRNAKWAGEPSDALLLDLSASQEFQGLSARISGSLSKHFHVWTEVVLLVPHGDLPIVTSKYQWPWRFG